jgi:hypothetical protein
MLAHPKDRIPRLRHFRFSLKTSNIRCSHVAAPSLFAKVLSLARNLQSIEVQGCENLLIHEPLIADALKHCTRLTTISIDTWYYRVIGRRSIGMVQGLSGIRRVGLGLVDPQHLVNAISPFHSTLESLYFKCPQESGPPFPDAAQWPLVVQLELLVPDFNAVEVCTCISQCPRTTSRWI